MSQVIKNSRVGRGAGGAVPTRIESVGTLRFAHPAKLRNGH